MESKVAESKETKKGSKKRRARYDAKAVRANKLRRTETQALQMWWFTIPNSSDNTEQVASWFALEDMWFVVYREHEGFLKGILGTPDSILQESLVTDLALPADGVLHVIAKEDTFRYLSDVLADQEEGVDTGAWLNVKEALDHSLGRSIYDRCRISCFFCGEKNFRVVALCRPTDSQPLTDKITGEEIFPSAMSCTQLFGRVKMIFPVCRFCKETCPQYWPFKVRKYEREFSFVDDIAKKQGRCWDCPRKVGSSVYGFHWDHMPSEKKVADVYPLFESLLSQTGDKVTEKQEQQIQDQVIQEVNKCRLRCASCYYLVTQERSWRKTSRRDLPRLIGDDGLPNVFKTVSS